jgi:hypothetical protein
MILAADYPFLVIFWTVLVFFLWVMWFWCLMIILTALQRQGHGRP